MSFFRRLIGKGLITMQVIKHAVKFALVCLVLATKYDHWAPTFIDSMEQKLIKNGSGSNSRVYSRAMRVK